MKTRIIFLLLVIVGSVFLPLKNANADRVAIFVNGQNDCCISDLEQVQNYIVEYNNSHKTIKKGFISVIVTPWNVFSNGDTQFRKEGGNLKYHQTMVEFVNTMNKYFSSLPDGSEVYLFGHSFGGDSILKFLEGYNRTKINIKLVALLDPVMSGGLRPTGYIIRNNVGYFFNRWQVSSIFPFDYIKSGKINCNAKIKCDQDEQKVARDVNGNTIYIACRAWEVTCPGYAPPTVYFSKGSFHKSKGSLGQKQQLLGHSWTAISLTGLTVELGLTFPLPLVSGITEIPAVSITGDEYINASLVEIFKILTTSASLTSLPPPPQRSKVKLCNKSSIDSQYASLKFVNNKWISQGWFSLKASECTIEDFGITKKGAAYYYVSSSSGEWPDKNTLNVTNFCADLGGFSIEGNKCETDNIIVPGAKIDIVPGINTVDIKPIKQKYTLTINNVFKGLGRGNVTVYPTGVNCQDVTCSTSIDGGVINGRVILTAHPNEGDSFAGWNGCTRLTNPNQCSLTMIQDQLVEAKFTSNPVIVIDKQGTGNGVVISSPAGIDCGLDCIEDYAAGDNFIRLQATPSEGSIFTGWFGFQAKECEGEINVNSFRYCIAQFDSAATNFELTISKNGSGAGVVYSDKMGIDCGENCMKTYSPDTRVTLIPQPEKNSSFRGWNGACSGTGVCNVVMYANQNINATFAIVNPKVFFVDNLNDSGSGSLRQAVLDANANNGDDTINFKNGMKGTISLTTGQLDITDSVVINGLGANVLAVSGSHLSRIFEISPGEIGTVAINRLTLKEGNDVSGGGGGGVIIDNGTVTINNCALSNNSANVGGGGGAIRKFGSGKLTVSNSTVSSNSAIDTFSQGDGGGIRNDQETLTIINSTVSGNSAANGGGITFDDGRLTIINSTVTNNSAINGGGGIFTGGGEMSLGNTMVIGNKAPMGEQIQSFGTLVSQGHNLFGENGILGITEGIKLANSDILLLRAKETVISPLSNNGGTTLTHGLVTGSPAINTGDNKLVLQGVITTDQRGVGFRRIIKDTVDIGAIEK